MGKGFAVASAVIVTAVLTSAFWIFAYNIALAPRTDGEVAATRDIAVVERPGPDPVVRAEAVEVGPAGIAIPVAGVGARALIDTYVQAREAGERLHDAIDIMAPAGAAVVAAAPGKVEKLFFSEGGGGITVYVRSDDGRWIYYYAHLQGYAPGLKEGQSVQRGQVIARVGSTGNANARGPHLHFAIHRMAEGERWWQGVPVNPYPLLVGRS